MPLRSPEQKAAGISPGGEGCQWPRALDYSPYDPNFLLLGIDVGGVYRSVDGGKTWRQSSAGCFARGMNAFAFDPKNPRRVLGLAGNGGDWNPGWGKSPNGIYLSTDRATTWKHVQPFPEGTGGALAFDRTKPHVAYCLTRTSGLWRSDDAGATWKKLGDGARDGGRLKVHPKSGAVFVGDSEGLRVSVDGGRSFRPVRPGPVFGLDFHPSGLLLLCGPDGIFASEDSGRRWRKLPARGVEQGGKPIQNVTVSPADPRRLTCWVEGDNYRWVRSVSRDGGNTFAPITFDLKGFAFPNNVRQGYFAWHPSRPETVFGIGGDIVTRSDDGGRTFRWAANGYNGVMLGGHFQFSTHAPTTVFLAFQDYNGAFTTDDGATWNYRDVSGKGWGGYCYGGHTVDGRTLWCGDAEGWGAPRKLRISRDGGATWSFAKDAAGKEIVWSGADVSASDPLDPKVLFASNWRSADGGASWEPMGDCDAVFAHAPDGKTLFGKKGDTVVRSTDAGRSWEKVADVSGGLRDLAWDDTRQRLYVASEDRLKVFEKGAWRTIPVPADSRGATHVRTVAVDPVDPRVVYIGGSADIYKTDVTVCRSVDAGATWENLTVGDGPFEVNAMRVHPKTRELWVNGQCFGMWRLPRP